MTYDKDSIEFQPFPSVHNFRDLTGQVFFQLTVLGYAGAIVPKRSHWFCECSCGTITVAQGASLQGGNTKSCGCRRGVAARQSRVTHDMTGTPEYRAYQEAKKRCNNPHTKRYPDYGGRGIEFRFASFEEFYAEIGLKPTPEHSLDRIKTNGHYEIGNVKWSTTPEQNRNKRSNIPLTYQGRTQILCEWAEELGIPANTLAQRRRAGWGVERILSTPRHT